MYVRKVENNQYSINCLTVFKLFCFIRIFHMSENKAR